MGKFQYFFLNVLMCEIFNNCTELWKGKCYYVIFFALVHTLSKFLTTNMVLRVLDNSIEKLQGVIKRNSFDSSLFGSSNFLIKRLKIEKRSAPAWT